MIFITSNQVGTVFRPVEWHTAIEYRFPKWSLCIYCRESLSDHTSEGSCLFCPMLFTTIIHRSCANPIRLNPNNVVSCTCGVVVNL